MDETRSGRPDSLDPAFQSSRWSALPVNFLVERHSLSSEPAVAPARSIRLPPSPCRWVQLSLETLQGGRRAWRCWSLQQQVRASAKQESSGDDSGADGRRKVLPHGVREDKERERELAAHSLGSFLVRSGRGQQRGRDTEAVRIGRDCAP